MLLTSYGSSILALMQPSTPTLDNLGVLAQRLEVVDAGDHRAVFLNGNAVARYRCDDKAAERILITQLAEVVPLSGRLIAGAFQIHPVTLSRLRGVARTAGTAALLPAKSGPKGPSKMTPEVEARCRDLHQQGLASRAIAQKVSTGGVRISHVTVAALFKSAPLAAPATDSPVATEPPATNSVATTGPRATTVLVAGIFRGRSRRAR